MRISDGISDVCSSDLVRPMWLRTPADGARPPTGAPPSTPGYAASQRIRKRLEEAFGWIKSVARMRKTKLRGLNQVDWAFAFAVAAYNLVPLPKLLASPPCEEIGRASCRARMCQYVLISMDTV